MAARDVSVVSFILVVLLTWMFVLDAVVLVFVLLLFCCGCWFCAVVALQAGGFDWIDLVLLTGFALIAWGGI